MYVRGQVNMTILETEEYIKQDQGGCMRLLNCVIPLMLGAGSMGTAMGGVPVEKVAEAIRKGGWHQGIMPFTLLTYFLDDTARK